MARWRDKLKGGRGDYYTPADFDQTALRAGIEHELEHTNDRHIATEIAMDHLTEDPSYYDKLERMEAGDCGDSNLLLWAGLVGGLGLIWYWYSQRDGHRP